MEEQLRQAQKLEAVGQLSGGIAHDFNNLLTVVHANAELLAEQGVGDDGADLLEDIRRAAGRGRDLVRRLMVFSRKETLETRPCRLDELEGYARTLRRLLPESIEVVWRCPAREPVARVDPGALQQILMNLATNARDAMPEGGTLAIVVSDAGPGLEIAVSDTGAGIPASEVDRIFEPFYTTKDPGKGTGLGLAMVYGLVGEMGGEIRVDSEPGAGTTFRLLFERAALPDAPSAEAGRAAMAVGAGERVLIVEDEEAIRQVTRRTLERLGYEVLTAADGREGLERLLAEPVEPDLVISDVVMPRMGGHELLRAVRSAGRDVPFLFMSGYTEEEVREDTDDLGGVFVLAKPWTREDLHAAVVGVLARDGAAAGPVP